MNLKQCIRTTVYYRRGLMVLYRQACSTAHYPRNRCAEAMFTYFLPKFFISVWKSQQRI